MLYNWVIFIWIRMGFNDLFGLKYNDKGMGLFFQVWELFFFVIKNNKLQRLFYLVVVRFGQFNCQLLRKF